MARNEFPVCDYDLAATLTSGQAFRWKRVPSDDPKRAAASLGVPPSGGSPRRVNAELRTPMAWEGVIQGRWVRLRQTPSMDSGCSPIEASTAGPQSDWRWLMDYLRLNDDHAAALASFPDDEPMRAATAHCHGLRLLRQEPWECLASFILSSTKQIVQIQQCVALLCQRYGEPLTTPHPAFDHPTHETLEQPTPAPSQEGNSAAGHIGSPAPLLGGVGGGGFRGTNRGFGQTVESLPVGWGEGRGEGPTMFAFPTPARIATASEAELRECKMGFRASYLLDAARRVNSGQLDLASLPQLPLAKARAALMECHGVGRKIADCVLLFSLGFDAAFPIDVWVERALQQLYFPRRRVKRARLERFATTHFGSHAGLAQQYLFHYLRTRKATRK